MASKKTPFIPLHVRGKGGAATPEDLNRVQDQVRAAFKKIQQGGVSQVTSRDGSVVLTPKTGVGTVDLSAASLLKVLGPGSSSLDTPANAPQVDSSSPAQYLLVEIDGVKFITPLWKVKTSTPFSPPAGCVLWLKADNASTVHSSGGNVSAWDDSLGSGYSVAPDVFTPPTIGTINGLPAIAFAANQKLRKSGTGAKVVSTNHARDVYVVAKKTAEGGSGIMIGMNGDDGGGWNVGAVNIGGTNRYPLVQWFGSDAYYNDGGHDLSGEVHIFRFYNDFSSATSTGYALDGTDVGALTWDGTFAETGADYFGVGGFATVTGGSYARDLVGLMGEVLIFDHVLGSGDDTAVRSYLKSKWGTP